MTSKHTKIIATLGPATDKPGMLEAILGAGVDIIRLNLSHGTHTQHASRVEAARAIASKLAKPLSIMADLQGPKLRIGRFLTGSIHLRKGDPFVIDSALALDAGTQTGVGLEYPDLAKDLQPEDQLRLDDGRIRLRVQRIVGTAIYCVVELGGQLSNHKGLNRSGGGLSAAALTDKDREDILFAATMKVDTVALSFPRDAADVHATRALLVQANSQAGVIAKIERMEAIAHLEAITLASDGLMVARGDLGVECGYAAVPVLQRRIIEAARTLGRPVIVATQMMESMVHQAIPTRAEASDVAHAVWEGADAVMLSSETAVGAFPLETVQIMREICTAAEAAASF